MEATLAPGATAIIESSGAALNIVRGFAEVIEVADQLIGVQATLTLKVGEQRIQSQAVGLTPGHERRSVMPADLRDALRPVELIWVSVTSSVALELTFRDLTGTALLTGKVDIEGPRAMRQGHSRLAVANDGWSVLDRDPAHDAPVQPSFG